MSKTELWIAIRNKGYSPKATAVILGHAQAESGCECDRVQGDFSADRALSRSYTARVDSGAVSREDFAWRGPNGGGYGLVQWTYPTRKLGLYDTAKRLGVSIGSEAAAVDWLDAELHQPEYAAVLAALTGGGSIREASDVFMRRFEMPYDQSESACAYRAGLAQAVYEELGGGDEGRETSSAPAGAPSPEGKAESGGPAAENGERPVGDAGPYWPPRTVDEGMDGPDVMLYQAALLCHGHSVLQVSGLFDSSTTKATKAFQGAQGLAVDGVIGPLTGRALLRWEG